MYRLKIDVSPCKNIIGSSKTRPSPEIHIQTAQQAAGVLNLTGATAEDPSEYRNHGEIRYIYIYIYCIVVNRV